MNQHATFVIRHIGSVFWNLWRQKVTKMGFVLCLAFKILDSDWPEKRFELKALMAARQITGYWVLMRLFWYVAFYSNDIGRDFHCINKKKHLLLLIRWWKGPTSGPRCLSHVFDHVRGFSTLGNSLVSISSGNGALKFVLLISRE